MANEQNLFAARKSLDEICKVPDKIISVYSLEKHVWADSNSDTARKKRSPALQTIEEFQIDPVRPFLTDILRNMAAPYKPERKENPIGQGYWIQAEFGSGKSHLLCLLAALALGRKDAWEIIQKKEESAGRGKRESLFRFWEEGIEAKSGKDNKGIFVIVKTLVGIGGGTVGREDKGRSLADYILEAAKEQIQIELGKNISLYPLELLADRFIREDLDRYRKDLGKFLRDRRYFEEDEFEDVDEFIRTIQQDKTPKYKSSCGDKLWRFYTEYLKVQPQIAAESEDILKHMVETILAEGYSGVLLVLDEISLFMVNRPEDQRWEDAKTLVVLANRLAKIHNLPIWTVCSAQQAIEARVADRNIVADDRLKLVKLLDNADDYYNIVLKRVRSIHDPKALSNYFLHYKRGFTWPNAIGQAEFERFFPFHKPAIEVLQAISYKLTTTRSAIAVMHQVLRYQCKKKGKELIRLWELFDEAVRYEEDPSGTYASLAAIKSQFEKEYHTCESCVHQIDSITKGILKVHRDKAIKVVQTLFLYHIAKTRQQGITSEEIANSVLIERDTNANPDENNQHYETIAENLKKELPQIVSSFDEDKRPRYRFDPVSSGVNLQEEFRKARDEAESNEAMLREAWDHLLALDEWPVRTRQMKIDLSNGVKSIFRDIAPFRAKWEDISTARSGDQKLEVTWLGKQISGLIGMRDLGRMVSENQALPSIDSDQTDNDFAAYIGMHSIPQSTITKILEKRKDPRIIIWTPAEITQEEKDRLVDFAAYRKLVSDWQGKDTEDAKAIINWVYDSLQTEMAKIVKIVDGSYARGRMDALNNSQMEFRVTGELTSILNSQIDRVLTAAYESRDIKFDQFPFRPEEGVKVINGIVKTGSIPKGAKPDKNISAAQNFGFGLKIIKEGAEKKLDVSGNRYIRDMWNFIDEKSADDGQTMKVDTIYKNFMGIGGPKDYGLTRRMVQIYLLCLVREGRIRLSVGPKSGLQDPSIDYSNLASVDFSVKVFDAFGEIQKVAKPANWEILRPYAEKLLGEVIPPTHDDIIISETRNKLRTLFTREQESAPRVEAHAQRLFEMLKKANPYENELSQVVKLFSANIASGNDIDLILHALKAAMRYKAFDDNVVSQAEVDDLANRLKNYRDLCNFLEFESKIRTACAYCSVPLPDSKELKDVRRTITRVREKLDDLQVYIDSEVILKTDLIGNFPPGPNEKDTISAMIQQYTSIYNALHDSVLSQIEEQRKVIKDTLDGPDLKALKTLEGITALQPADTEKLEEIITKIDEGLFQCPSSSRASIDEQLRGKPLHECGLSFVEAESIIQKANEIARESSNLLNLAYKRKMEILLNPKIQERLKQGKSEPVIAGLLKCKDITEVREYLIKAVGGNPQIVDVINRYLKRIIVRRVKLIDFKPKLNTIQKDQVDQVTDEFKHYLEIHLNDGDIDDDSLLMIQLE